jgi:hypothetical protein
MSMAAIKLLALLLSGPLSHHTESATTSSVVLTPVQLARLRAAIERASRSAISDPEKVLLVQLQYALNTT